MIESTIREHRDRFYIEPWTEVRGQLIRVTDVGSQFICEFSTGELIFPINSTEAAILRDELDGEIGAIVSVLRTDTERESVSVIIESGDQCA